MTELNGLCIAIIATDGFEEPELVDTLRALQAKGAQVDVLAPKPEIQGFVGGKRADPVLATRLIENVKATDYHAAVIPGGPRCCRYLCDSPHVTRFLKEIQEQAKPIAAMGPAVQVLSASGLVRGRRVSAPAGVTEELTRAGAVCVDQPVVIDSNWVTARDPENTSEFLGEVISLFSRSTPPVIQIAESA